MMQATTTTKPELKVVCTECRRDNEPERIFCHDCGARLDRSGLAKAQAKAEEAAHETHTRVKNMFDPARGRMRRNFFLVCKLILGAVVVAGGVQIFRAPELPPSSKDASAFPPPIIIDMEDAAGGKVPSLQYSDEQVNAFLASALKSKQSILSKYVHFDGLVLSFNEGVCRATVKRSYYGVPLYMTRDYAPRLENGKLVLKNCGGQLGRLAVHPLVMQYGDFLFSDLATALQRERNAVAKMGALELHPKQVVFVTKPRV